MAKRKELMPREQFVKLVITKLQKENKIDPKTGQPYKGIHASWDHFNSAFKEYYGEDPIAATKKLAEDGHIVIIPTKKGGVRLYLPEDAPGGNNKSAKGKEVLSKIFEGF